MAVATLTVLTKAFDVARLEQEWRTLENHADTTFFISWSWISAWLEVVREHCELYLFRCEEDGEPIGLGIFVHEQQVRRHFLTSSSLSLHQAQAAGLNMNIEYNGLLCKRGRDHSVTSHLFQALNESKLYWLEVTLSAISQSHWQQLHRAKRHVYWLVDRQLSPWVRNIEGITTLANIFAPLSRNRRGQIRRSISDYEKAYGPIHCHAAQSTSEALNLFEELGVLHTRRWNKDGKAGSFANPNWVNFHRLVIERAFPRGEVQVLKVSAGSFVLGVIYSFVWKSQVHVLQTGFVPADTNRDQPGYVSHCLAILENAKLGMKQYDLMCGDAYYKSVLGERVAPLYWVRARRHRAINYIEDSLIALYRRSLRTLYSKS